MNLFLCVSLVLPWPLMAANPVVTIQPGKILCIRMESRAKMHIGAGVSGTLAEPVYVRDQIAIAAGTKFIGHVTELADGPASKRVRAMMDGDFTPPHEAVVQFDYVVASDGRWLTVHTRFAFCIPGEKDVSSASSEKESILEPFREPDRLQRIGDAMLAKLPYHPQHISRGDVFHAELDAPLDVISQGMAKPTPDALLAVQLLTPLDTKTAEIDEPVDAVVSAPYFAPDGKLLLPEGTKLTGRVTEVHSAGMLIHAGKLRFHVNSAHLPDGTTMALNAEVSGIESSRGDHMKVDPEGQLSTSSSKLGMAAAGEKVISPARSAADPGVEKTGFARANAGMSGFGAIGSAAAQVNPVTATGFGAYGAAKAIYWNFIGPGKDVVLPVGTRVLMRLERAAEAN
jgi:hypothetical protein